MFRSNQYCHHLRHRSRNDTLSSASLRQNLTGIRIDQDSMLAYHSLRQIRGLIRLMCFEAPRFLHRLLRLGSLQLFACHFRCGRNLSLINLILLLHNHCNQHNQADKRHHANRTISAYHHASALLFTHPLRTFLARLVAFRFTLFLLGCRIIYLVRSVFVAHFCSFSISDSDFVRK